MDFLVIKGQKEAKDESDKDLHMVMLSVAQWWNSWKIPVTCNDTIHRRTKSL